MARVSNVTVDKLLQVARFLRGVGTGKEIAFSMIRTKFGLPANWCGHLLVMGFLSHQDPKQALERQGKRGYQQLVVGPGPFTKETIDVFFSLRRGVSSTVTTTITERVIQRVEHRVEHVDMQVEEEHHPQPAENVSATDIRLKEQPYGQPFVRQVVTPEVEELSRLVRELHRKVADQQESVAALVPPIPPVAPSAPVVKKEYKSVEIDMYEIVVEVGAIVTGGRTFYRLEDLYHPNTLRLLRAKFDAAISEDITTVVFTGEVVPPVSLQAGIVAAKKGCEVLYRPKKGNTIRL